MPGVPRGEEALDQTLSMTEVCRRCELRYPGYKQTLFAKTKMLVPSGDIAPYALKRGDVLVQCMIPGGDKPSAKLVDTARRDPMPTTTAAQLRNCSVMFWTDVTKWRVVV